MVGRTIQTGGFQTTELGRRSTRLGWTVAQERDGHGMGPDALVRDAAGGDAEKGGDGPGMMGRFIIPVLVLVGALVRVLALD
jgi:hypothetical protein